MKKDLQIGLHEEYTESGYQWVSGESLDLAAIAQRSRELPHLFHAHLSMGLRIWFRNGVEIRKPKFAFNLFDGLKG